jgi:threonine dehydrogenase-like Zn-dependent dehydrogenase
MIPLFFLPDSTILSNFIPVPLLFLTLQYCPLLALAAIMTVNQQTSYFPTSHKDGLNIIVIGAGIAGLATARALREKHNVCIFEQSRMKTETGACIQ